MVIIVCFDPSRWTTRGSLFEAHKVQRRNIHVTTSDVNQVFFYFPFKAQDKYHIDAQMFCDYDD